MNALFPVMAGGALGAGARFLLGQAMPWRGGWPWATFSVNLLGGLLMGLLAGAVLRGQLGETARLFLGVGVLGGFTTFSAFSLENIQLLERGQGMLALGYALASVCGALAALALGYGLTRA